MRNLSEWFNWVLVFAGALLLVLLLTAESAEHFFWRYSAKLWLAIILALVLYVGFLFFRRCYFVRLIQWEKKFLVISVVVISMLGIAEGFLRISGLPRDKIGELLPNLNVILRPDPSLLPGVKETARLTTDRMGFRVTHPIDYLSRSPKTLRLFAVGGSTTESFYIDDKETWPALLEAQLDAHYRERGQWDKVEIINAGRSGEFSTVHLEKAKDFLHFGPNGYIFLMGANDLLITLRNLDGTGKEIIAQEVKIKKVLDPLDRLYEVMVPLWRSTKLSRLFSDSYNIVFNPSEFRKMDNVGQEVQALRDETQQAKLVDLPPEYLIPNQGYRDNVSKISQVCRDSKITCVFLTQPYMYYDGMPPDLEKLLGLRPKEPDYKFPVADMARVFEEYNDVLRRANDGQRVYVMDLARTLPKDATVFYDDVHFNSGGSTKVAEAVASFIIQQDLFSRP